MDTIKKLVSWRQKGSALLILLVIGAVLGGIGAGYLWLKSQPAPAPEVQTPETLKISSVNVPDLDILFAIANDKGFAEKYGLTLEIVYSAPAEAERKLATREPGIEIGAFGPIGMAEENAKGNDLREFAPSLYNSFSFLVRKGSPYQTLQDLRGEKIAIRPKVSAAYKALSIAIRLAGMDLDKDFELMFGSIPETIKFFTTGEADATMVTPLLSVPLLTTGQYREILDLENEWKKIAGKPMDFVGWAAHKDWIEKNPKKMTNFRKMMFEAIAYVQKNPAAVVREYKDILGLKTDADISLAEKVLPTVHPPTWDIAANHFIVTKAIEFGLIPNVSHTDFFIP